MPGKTATISDLFSPMNSIKTCMDSHGVVIANNLMKINESVLGCASTLSSTNKLIEDATKIITKTVLDSMKDFNTAVQKQITTKPNDKLFSGLADTINTNFSVVKSSLDNVVESLNVRNKALEKKLGSGFKDVSKLNDALKTLNESLKVQTTSTVGMSAGIVSTISEAFSTTAEGFKEPLGFISSQLTDLLKLVKQIEGHVDPVKSLKYRTENTLKTKLNPFAKNVNEVKPSKPNTIQAPDVSGGKGAGDLAKALADAAKEIDKIGIVRSKMIKTKANNIIGGLLDVFSEKEKQMKGNTIEKYAIKVKELAVVADKIGDIAKTMASAMPFAPFAIIGAKLSKKVINELLLAIRPLSKGSTIAKQKVAAENLRIIADSILIFEAKIALSIGLAVPARIGIGMTKWILNNVHIMLLPLSKVKTTKSMVTAAKNLAIIGNSILKFNAAMALTSLLAIPALVGVGTTWIIMKTTSFLFKTIGNKKNTVDIRTAAVTIEIMCMSMIGFTLSVLASTMISRYLLTGGTGQIDPLNIVSLATSVSIFGLMIGTYAIYKKLGSGKGVKNVMTGSYSLLLMSSSMILFTLAVATSYMITRLIIGDTLRDGKFDLKDLAAIGSAVPIFFLMLGAYRVYRKLGKVESAKDVIYGGLAITMMSVGLIAFAASLYITHQITKSIVGNWDSKKDPKALIMDVAVLGLMLVSYGLYERIGKPQNVKQVLAAGLGVVMMSVGIVTFSAALWLSNKMIGDMWKNENGKFDFGAMITSVGVLGLMFLTSIIFEGVGNNFANIAKGSAGVALMSLGLAFFGAGLFIYNIGSEDITLGKIAILGAFGIEFGLMGAGPVPAAIALGAAASLAMSVGLGVFGFAMKYYVDSVGNYNWNDIKKYAGLIGVFSLEFAAMGIGSPLILLGSVAALSTAGALVVFGKAMQTFLEPLQNIKFDITKNMAKTIGLLGAEVAGMGILAVPIAIGSGALVTMGKGLSSLGKSLGEWDNVNVDETKLKMICKAVDTIKLAFQGDPEGKKNGLQRALGNIVGAVFAPTNIVATKATAEMLKIAGSSLTDIAKNLSSFEAANINEDAINNVVEIVGKIGLAFSEIGEKNNAGKRSLMKRLVGIDFSAFEMTNVDRGIRSAKRMGEALTEIAKGIVEYTNGIGSKFKDPKYIQELTESISTVLTSLTTAFSSLTAETVETKKASTLFGKLWQDITINTYGTTTKAEAGIRAVRHLGSSLKDIAEGMKSFKELVPNGNNSFVVNVAAGISALLQGIQEPLIAFGTTDESFKTVVEKAQSASDKYGQALSSIHDISKQTMNYEHHKVDVAAALKNVGQIGAMIKGLADGVKTLSDKRIISNLGTAGTIGDDFVVNGGDGLIGNIQQLVCSQVAVFLQLGKKIQEVGIFDDIQTEVVQDVTKGLFRTKTKNKSFTVNKGKKSYLAIAVESTVGIGSVIQNLAEGLKSMNDAFPTNAKMVDGISRVNRAIIGIMSAFSMIGYAVMKGQPGDTFDAIPQSINDPELSKKFGKIPGELGYLGMISGSSMNSAIENVKNITDAFVTCIKSISDNDSNIKKFMNDVTPMMNATINLMQLGNIMGDHEAGTKLTIFGTRNVYDLPELKWWMFDSAKTKSIIIKDTVANLATCAPNIAKLTVKSGQSFVTFANAMTKGMNTLAGTKTNIQHSTKFVNTLRLAVKENVFGNISDNTQRIATAINSIDSDVFEPYAKMIAALGTMTEKHDEFVKMQKELLELFEQLIDKINSANTITNETNNEQTSTQAASGNSKQNGSQANTQPKQQPQLKHQPQQLVAKLQPSTVTFDQAQINKLLNDIATVIRENRV